MNKEKFDLLRSYNFPIGHYAIAASGPMGIRNLREINDIDLIVSPELWDVLADQFGVTDENGVKKIVLPGKAIEAVREGSFYSKPAESGMPTVEERIRKAEIIEGLPFDSLENTLYFKKLMGREKDLRDISIIENWLRQQNKNLSS